MFDLWSLIDLPKPDTFETGALTPEDAAIKLRQAATLRLKGAQSVLLHSPKDLAIAVELLDDAAVLFDKALRHLEGIPAYRVHQQINEYCSDPSDKACLGIRTPSADEIDRIIEDGVRCAEAWLDDSSQPLWWALAKSRKRHRPGDPQEAFEAGFLLRLQQALRLYREASTSQAGGVDAWGCS